MTPPATSLARDEVRLEDGTVTRVIAGETWIEFEDSNGYQGRNDILNRYTIHDIVTDAVQVKTTDEEGKTHIGDYEMESFRENAGSGHLVPKDHAFPKDEPPDAAEITENIVAGVNASIDAAELMDEFDQKHNALQQEAFTSVVKPLVIALATTPQTDRRNEYAVERAEEIVDMMGWEIPAARQ